MDLHGKTAIVTGASSGIGAATVRSLREAGVRVAAGARRVERLDADVVLALDVTDEESAAVFVEQAVSELGGGINILFNNAGLALGRYPFTESTLEDRPRSRPPHERRRRAPDDQAHAPAHPRRRAHPLHGLRCRPPGVSERCVVRRIEVRAPRLCLRAARGPARAPDPDHDRRRGLVDEFSLVRYRWDEEAAKAVRASTRLPRRDRGLRDVRSPGRSTSTSTRSSSRRSHSRAAHESSGGRAEPLLTILEGSTFCMSDELGDIAGDTAGFFAWDTRFLSRLVLRIDGARPLPLSAGRLQHFAAAFYLRNPRGRAPGRLTVDRATAVRRHGPAGADRRAEREHGTARVRAVNRARRRLRGHHLREAARLRARRSRARTAASTAGAADARGANGANGTPREADGDARTRIVLSTPGPVRRTESSRTRWRSNPTRAGSSASTSAPRSALCTATWSRRWTGSDDEIETIGDVVEAWTLRVPKLRGGWEALRRAFDQSVADLAALRIRTGEERRPLFAAGMPWFMTVFGRDTAITSLQTLLLGPELAAGALDVLAELQATTCRPGRSTPSRARSSTRCGTGAQRSSWFNRYYGSIDSTPALPRPPR